MLRFVVHTLSSYEAIPSSFTQLYSSSASSGLAMSSFRNIAGLILSSPNSSLSSIFITTLGVFLFVVATGAAGASALIEAEESNCVSDAADATWLGSIEIFSSK